MKNVDFVAGINAKRNMNEKVLEEMNRGKTKTREHTAREKKIGKRNENTSDNSEMST